MQQSRSLLILQMDLSIIDWMIYLFNQLDQPLCVFKPDHAFKTLLGQEHRHVLFDASTEFNLDHFMMLSGTLTAGSVCILVLPKSLDQFVDQSSLRWNQSEQAKNTPNFNQHLINVIKKTQAQFNPNHIAHFIQKKQPDQDLIQIKRWIKQTVKQTSVQTTAQLKAIEASFLNACLNKQLKKQDRPYLISGKRGRGKSTLLGQWSQSQSAWLTAPSKAAAARLLNMNPSIPFFAPDQLAFLLMQLQENQGKHLLETKSVLPDFLLIDEVAMIPLALTKLFLAQSWTVVMMTTTEGYEGTGQAILQKLDQQYLITHLNLEESHRFLANDALEFFADQLALSVDEADGSNDFDLPHQNHKLQDQIVYATVSQPQMLANGILTYWQLLKKAHYKTNLSDLRRLFDGDGLRFYQACADEKGKKSLLALLMTIEEGSLDLMLIEQIMQGYRRPKGNLFVQSLATHAFCAQAAQLRSLRIHRIAVIESRRRSQIATQLIQTLIFEAQNECCDFISVSFSYDKALLSFWQKLGFVIVHIGTSQETATGEQAVMMMYALSQTAQNLQRTLQTKLKRDALYWQAFYPVYQRILMNEAINSTQQTTLNRLSAEDLKHLRIFAQTQAVYSAIAPALFRLVIYLQTIHLALFENSIYLKQWHELKQPFDFKSLKTGSKKSLIFGLRQEILSILQLIEKTNVPK